MKNYTLILSAAILTLASCSQNTRTTGKDSIVSQAHQQLEEKTLFAKMQIEDTVKTGDLVQLKFSVYNNTDSIRQFCKWHTPFEPLMSKYLEVKDAHGAEALYQGPMAKRMMPPPANSYISINPKDSLSITTDLLKAYAIRKPGRYTIKYTGQNMSSLVVKDSISFVYAE